VRYREIPPGKSLARFVECFWILESNREFAPTRPERILPDGCVELILNLRDPFSEIASNGHKRLQPRYFLVGQMTRPILISPTGVVELIGIRFHPGGTLPFFPFPMRELTNQVTELSGISKQLERDLAPIIESGVDVIAKVKAIEEVLAKRAAGGKDSRLIGLATEIVSRAGKVSIDAVARCAGISSRQLERRFLNEIGLGPKLFCRILRFQKVFQAIDSDDPNWAAVASDCGYYDQAHLIRDFQQFAQQTPAVLMAESTPLTEAFSRKRRMSDFSNTCKPTL
jgi:AraC-like DNA-binding protein